MHEFELINKYFTKLTKSNNSSLNLNDDVFFNKEKNLAISTDTYTQGIHFFDFKKPELVIKKIIRSSISDLVCKGVLPKYYFISASGNNRAFSKANLSKLSNSLMEEQKKYKIFLCGGDTTFSNNLSFSITSVGFSKNIIFRNNAKNNDNIYITGNLGDSYIGLSILKNKINIQKKYENYFIKKYYLPDIKINLTKTLFKYANSSIDVSDGLIADLDKMINKQKLSYVLYLDKIPISQNLKRLIKKNKLNKSNLISNGDDYQILFTASPNKARIIQGVSRNFGIKITKIGKFTSRNKKSIIIDQKGKQIVIKNKGYTHQF